MSAAALYTHGRDVNISRVGCCAIAHPWCPQSQHSPPAQTAAAAEEGGGPNGPMRPHSSAAQAMSGASRVRREFQSQDFKLRCSRPIITSLKARPRCALQPLSENINQNAPTPRPSQIALRALQPFYYCYCTNTARSLFPFARPPANLAPIHLPTTIPQPHSASLPRARG